MRFIIGLAISLFLGWRAIDGMEWGLVADQFQEFPVVWAVASLAIVLLASFFRAYRWQVLFVGQKVPLARLFLVQNAGIGLNNLAPVRMVSEGAQFAILTLKYRVNGGVALGTLGVERILDMVVTATILMAGLTLLPTNGDFIPYVVGAFVFAIGSVLTIPFVIWLSDKPFLKRFPLLVSTVTFLLDLAKSRVTLAWAFLLTLAHWVLVGVSAWVLAHGMGMDITAFVATLAILGTLYFATAIPGLPAAAGTFEFAVVHVLKFFEVPQELALSYGLVIHAVIFLPPIVVAVFFFSSFGLRTLMQSGRTGTQETARAVFANEHEGDAQ